MHSRRLRIVRPSLASRDSRTRVSVLRHDGQRIDSIDSVYYAEYNTMGRDLRILRISANLRCTFFSVRFVCGFFC